MNETGVTYRALGAKTGLSAGYLNHLVHGNRPVPSNDVVETLAGALGVEPEHFREYRLRVITERLEAMPDLVDRLYRNDIVLNLHHPQGTIVATSDTATSPEAIHYVLPPDATGSGYSIQVCFAGERRGDRRADLVHGHRRDEQRTRPGRHAPGARRRRLGGRRSRRASRATSSSHRRRSSTRSGPRASR
jgi:transcriptional regulator with XRE-family HTH domain